MRDSSAGRGNRSPTSVVGHDLVERRQPRGLRGRVLGVRRDEIQRLARLERVFDERVELGMRQLRDDLDAHLRLLLERRDGVVQRVVHRPADEGGAHGRQERRSHGRLAATFPRSIHRQS